MKGTTQDAVMAQGYLAAVLRHIDSGEAVHLDDVDPADIHRMVRKVAYLLERIHDVRCLCHRCHGLRQVAS